MNICVQGLDFNHDGYISFEELIAGLQALTANEDASTPYGSSGQRLSSSGRAVSVDRASPVSPCLSSSSILRSYSSATGIPKHPELLHEQSRPSIVVEDQESTPVPADQRKGIKAEDADCSVSQVPGDPILHDERSTTSVCRHEDTSISIQDGGTSPTVPSSANVPTWRNDANSPRHSGPPIPPIPLLVIINPVCRNILYAELFVFFLRYQLLHGCGTAAVCNFRVAVAFYRVPSHRKSASSLYAGCASSNSTHFWRGFE